MDEKISKKLMKEFSEILKCEDDGYFDIQKVSAERNEFIETFANENKCLIAISSEGIADINIPIEGVSVEFKKHIFKTLFEFKRILLNLEAKKDE